MQAPPLGSLLELAHVHPLYSAFLCFSQVLVVLLGYALQSCGGHDKQPQAGTSSVASHVCGGWLSVLPMCLQSAADKTSSHNQAQPHQLHQRVVPLFETLDDLNNAGATLARLLNTPWYRQQLRCASSL